MQRLHKRSPSEANLERFRESVKQTSERMDAALEKLVESCDESERDRIKKEIDGFSKIFKQYSEMESATVDWEKIELPKDGTIPRYEALEHNEFLDVRELLNKLVVIKLNGGLGTSMGCTGPKSVISVRSNMTFLDLTVQQLLGLNAKYGVNIPFVLMNSFNTDEDTRQVLEKYTNLNLRIEQFCQSMHPRLNKESLLPIAKSVNDKVEYFYPPGHGDIYESLSNSGLLDKFIEEGKEFAFISNVDNLGATVDENILKFLYSCDPDARPEFVMEVTDKTHADVKGGTLVQYEGKTRLLEIAQVPKIYEDEFKSVKKFKIFNTNNLWVDLRAMRRVIDSESLDMEIIVNPKTIEEGRSVTNVIQLERACGGAIKCFDRGIGINVPRRRFLPVKTTSDLLIVMSNLYTLRNGMLDVSAKRQFDTQPLVKLGSEFTKVKSFLSRFETIPDIIELNHLTVSGDVTFGKNVSLKGTVIIIANHGDRIDIPSGSVLENKIVSGNLRILNH